jgi:hypothetical protein
MRAIPVEGALELEELHLKVGGRPEQRAIHALASNGPSQTLDEAAGALHPQALQIGMTIANRGSAALRPFAASPSRRSIRLSRGNASRNLVANSRT